MRSEEVVPLNERYLVVEGHLSAKTRQTIRKGFRRDLAPTSRVCFISHAYADLPLPREFDSVFPVSRVAIGTEKKGAAQLFFRPKQLAAASLTRVVIEEALDTSYELLSQIPDGARTICVLQFPDGVPFMIDDLPTVKDWGASSESVVLCSHETVEALKQSSKRG